MCFPSICEEEIPSSLHKQIICGASGRAARKCCGAALNSTCVVSRSTDLGIQTWKSTSTGGHSLSAGAKQCSIAQSMWAAEGVCAG